MVLFFIALAAFAFFLERWSISNALNGVEFEYAPSLLLAAPDEVFDVVADLTNRSMRFVPFVRVEEFLPPGTAVYDQTAKVGLGVKEDVVVSFTTYLAPRSGLRSSVPVSIPARGRYVFHGAQLGGGDFLGLSERGHRVGSFSEIVIYPREGDTGPLDVVMGSFLGDLSVRRFIIEDPVLTSGFREYTGREPMKAISWTQSARAGNIMVKSFDFTTEPSVTVLLNVECDEMACSDEEKIERIESCYSMTHTVCRILEERKIQYDFYTNATTSGAFADWSYLGEGLGHKHFFTILEGLGRASHRAKEPFSAAMKRVDSRSGGSRRSLVILTPTDKNYVMAHVNKENVGQVLVIPAGEVLR